MKTLTEHKVNPATFQNLTLTNVLGVLFAFLLLWLLLHYLSRLSDRLSTAAPRARYVVRLLEPMVRIVAWFVFFFIVIELFAPNQDAVFAALGSAALAIGLGAQDLIKNVLGGIAIIADRPFQIGDRIRVGETYGEVERIGLRSTRLLTHEGFRVTVPNSELASVSVANSNSGVPQSHVVAELFLPPDCDVTRVRQIAREAALTSPYAFHSYDTVVTVLDSYTETPFVTVRINSVVYDHQYERQMLTDMTRRAKAEFVREGMLAGWKERPTP